jgi:hypothetical protein
MKTNVLKLTVFFLILVGSLSSCSKLQRIDLDGIEFEDLCNDLYKESIVGKWKLVEVKCWYHTNGWHLRTFNYSQNDIVYEFTKNATLLVSGDVDSTIYWYGGFEQGTYPYLFIEDKNGNGMPGLPYGLEIGIYGAIYWYRFFSDELEITLAPVDGPAYYFVRIIN